ncbi:hypothetical protein B566_EDAN010024 [Ephemera danica]|nr:hypothetical protein B566_EDAN010024 [Ephemera danica]
MAVNLSEGAVSALMSQATIDPPILQVLGVKKLNHPGTTDRYRIMLSDGLHSINFAMLATQHNPKIETREISDNCIVRLNHHITSMLNKDGGERRVLIVLDIEVLIPGNEMSKIGNPIMFNDDSAPPPPTGQATTAAPAPAPQMNGNARPSMANIERPTKMARLELPQNNAPSDGIVTRPISSINPYQHKWKIRALVTSKSPIRTWSNSRGEGSLFSLDLKDETGEIRATAFKDECDKFYNLIDVDKVYYVSNCVIKNANKKFSTLKHDFELTFTRDTQVVLVENQVVNIPGLQYNFTPIAQLATAPMEELVDVIGVCKSFGDLNTFMARVSGRELKKRDVTLVDNSGATINLALWSEKAVDFDGTDHPIVALRQARINEFQGTKNISTGMSTVVTMNPNMPEAHRLRGWYDNGGADEPVVNISANQGASGNAQGKYNCTVPQVKFVQMKMRMRVKGEVYNDERRLKTVAAKLELVDVKENNIRMLREINAMKAQGVKIEPLH